jgi:hypothetical protein
MDSVTESAAVDFCDSAGFSWIFPHQGAQAFIKGATNKSA